MARLPIPNGDNDTCGNILNDFLSVAHNPDGTLKTSDSVVSGTQLDSSGVSITSTVAGAGTSDANGSSAIAIGSYAAASNSDAIALGDSASSAGDRSVAIGSVASSQSGRSVAMGSNTTIDSTSSSTVVIGYSSSATGGAADAIVIGTNTSATASRGIASGFGTSVSNADGVAIGSYATVSGASGVAIGNSTTASADGSVALGADHLGFGAQATAPDDFVLGTANHTVQVPGHTSLHGLSNAVSTQTAAYTASSTDSTILANGTFTVTLPSTATVGIGRQYTIKNIGTGTITVASGGGTIDGAASLTLSVQYGKTTVQSDGTQWWTIA